MSFVTFNYNKHLIYAIIYWILEIINRFIMYLRWDFFQIIEEDSINEYLYVIMLNIADLLAGFLVLYINCSLKKKSSEENKKNENKSRNSTGINLIVREGNISPKSKIFIFKIILICSLDYLNRGVFFIFYQIFEDAVHDDISDKPLKDIIIHLDILARYFFSILILKAKVFKHHKLAIIIILIGFLILFPTDIISLYCFSSKEISKYTFPYIGILSITGILYPLQDTIIKQIFTDDYIIPEILMFIRGLGELIIILIITPFLFYFIWMKENIIFKDTLTSNILMIIFYTLTSFVKNYVLLKIIYYFSSQSVSFLILSESVTCSLTNIINFFKSNDDYNNHKNYYFIILMIEIIVILISMVGTLIYDEIIVIRKWELELNVAKEISERSVLDLSTIRMIDDNPEEEEVEEE